MHLYTIGYATKPVNVFLQHLRLYNVDVVADVRSVPYSNVYLDYHRESIANILRQNSIRYVFLGEELGPRSKESSHYDESGQVQFDRLMRSQNFIRGIERLTEGVVNKRLSVALMCAEKDPATCHRSLLIAYYLQRLPAGDSNDAWEVSHICHDGSLESQQELEARIAAMHNQGQDLFMTQEQCYEQAYKKQLEHTSYRLPELS